MVAGLLFVGLLAAGQAQTLDACNSTSLSAAAMQLCLGDEESRRALALPAESPERSQNFETAAAHYRLASVLGTSELQLKALTALAVTYDGERLNNPTLREGVIRELSLLVPNRSVMLILLRYPMQRDSR